MPSVYEHKANHVPTDMQTNSVLMHDSRFNWEVFSAIYVWTPSFQPG